MESLPAYVEDQLPQNAFDALLTRIASPATTLRHPNARVILENFVEGQRAPAYHLDDTTNVHAPSPIEEYPSDPDPGSLEPDPVLIHIKQRVVEEFFTAIGREEDEFVALFIQNNLVTANTTNKGGLTPLLAAIVANVMPIVKQLLVLGADHNKFGVINTSTRTPLMLAASQGSLPIVKLLFEEPYRANDGLVAPDGQIALRLAAAGGHTAIVAYLPSRRVGGFLRFKAANAVNIERIKKAARAIYGFARFFGWSLPKFFLWSIPKHLLVLPIVRSCKWCWGKRKEFARWCKYQVTELPKRFGRAGKAVWTWAKKTPEFLGKVGKGIWNFASHTVPRWAKAAGLGLWNFFTKTVPRWGRAAAVGLWKFFTQTLPVLGVDCAIWLWKLFTVRIPKAILIALKWTWAGLRAIGVSAWSIITKLASLIHTSLLAIATFLTGLTLRDIWNALYDVLHAIFVTVPTTLLSWAENFGKVSYKIMGALFGWFGEGLWWVVRLLGEVVTYVPKKVWVIIQSIGSSLAKAVHEIVVWINPKV